MDKTRRYYNKAIECYQNGYIETAIEFCEKSISYDIKNKASLDLKGILYYLKGDISGAKALWRLSERENNDSVAKKYLEGIENDEKRLELYVKAIGLIQEVKINEALKLLITCADSDFNSINVNNYLSICYMKTGEFDIAIECVEKVLSIDVKNEIAIDNRKNLIKYGVIKGKKAYGKVICVFGVICVAILLIFIFKPIKNTKNDLKVTRSSQINKASAKITKPKINKKSDNKAVQVQFPGVDFKNVLVNKDFEKLYDYCEKWKDQKLEPSDKTLVTQGINLLTSDGATYFYKSGTAFYSNKDYNNSVIEYLKAYEYGTSSYLLPHIIYFMANSYQELNDYNNALKYYGVYDTSYSKGDYEETVLYQMAIMSRDKNDEVAKRYATKLVDNYPKSIYNNSNIQSIINSNN
ncbi:tetratricopeptide repeat protein [Clostridium akagii]|uniref:tetratricopeptide repeat protein n=1 Tax=Clostridium akagii TaxID=91623 RepID=UPI00047B215C|nr:tetratricopeptide repeat protein [Clostridium akagii]